MANRELRDNYLVYAFTANGSRTHILASLGVTYRDIINKEIYSKKKLLDFFQVLSYQTLVYPGPILFLVNSMDAVVGNSLWLKNRKYEDIFIDLNGNIKTAKEIMKLGTLCPKRKST